MSECRNAFVGQRVTGGWTIERYLSSGAFGSVYAVRGRDGRRGVMKIENSRDGSLKHEVRVLERLQHMSGFPQLYSSGKFRGYRMAVMQRLGQSLASLSSSHRLRTKDILKLGIQMVERLKDLHGQGLVHRDLHEGNILTGDQRAGESGKLYLIDFGESGNVDGRRPGHMYGNLLFASTAALELRRYAPKDDLESLVYLLVYLCTGRLPWSRLLDGRVSTDDYIRRCLEMRCSLSSSEICAGVPGSILEMLRDLRSMSSGETPDYEMFIQDMKASLRNRGHSQNERFSWE